MESFSVAKFDDHMAGEAGSSTSSASITVATRWQKSGTEANGSTGLEPTKPSKGMIPEIV